MKVEDFVLLTEDQKISLLWYQAEFIAERKENIYNVLLYQVNSFYLEVWYSYNLMNIHTMRSFSNTNELEPYLEKIDISEIIRS